MWKKVAPRYVVTEQDQLSVAIAQWVFDSHFWIEEYPGYYTCDWCGYGRTSLMPITKDDRPCPENPVIRKLLGK